MTYIQKKLQEFDELYDQRYEAGDVMTKEDVKIFLSQMFQEVVGEVEGLIPEIPLVVGTDIPIRRLGIKGNHNIVESLKEFRMQFLSALSHLKDTK